MAEEAKRPPAVWDAGRAPHPASVPLLDRAGQAEGACEVAALRYLLAGAARLPALVRDRVKAAVNART